MRIGIDIDNTIKDTHSAAVQVYNRVLNKQVQNHEVRDFYLNLTYNLTKEEGHALWNKHESEIYTLGVPLDYAVEALNTLEQEGHELFYITARPDTPPLPEITRDWLKKHGFPFTEERLYMNAQDKSIVAKKLAIDLFFEDAPVHLDRLVAAGINTIIMDAVYNRDYPDLRRIHSWHEGLELIRSLS